MQQCNDKSAFFESFGKVKREEMGVSEVRMQFRRWNAFAEVPGLACRFIFSSL